eukprot:3245220-Amphidinium_carterae.1
MDDVDDQPDTSWVEEKLEQHTLETHHRIGQLEHMVGEMRNAIFQLTSLAQAQMQQQQQPLPQQHLPVPPPPGFDDQSHEAVVAGNTPDLSGGGSTQIPPFDGNGAQMES